MATKAVAANNKIPLLAILTLLVPVGCELIEIHKTLYQLISFNFIFFFREKIFFARFSVCRLATLLNLSF